jgi:hypothetical protein
MFRAENNAKGKGIGHSEIRTKDASRAKRKTTVT